MDDITLARALHVLGIIHWIGGVAFVTIVVLPLAQTRSKAEEGLALFRSVERRFSRQVRISIALVGATGLWMVYRLDLWARFADPQFWWLSAMFGLWLIFALIVYGLEPRLHGRFERAAARDPAAALRRMSLLHGLLLALAALTAFGAVLGSHGFTFF